MVETLAVLQRDRPAESGEPLPSPDRVLFSSALVRIGSFRCPPDHPRFSDAPRVQSHLMACPRSSVSITHDGGRPFVFDPAHASLYNPGQGYLRKKVSPEGDRATGSAWRRQWCAAPTRSCIRATRTPPFPPSPA